MFKTNSRSGPVVLLVAIFLINFLSLVFQVVWMRKIMVIFGSSALSISTTLTVFLSGIAIGGYIGSRIVHHAKHRYRLCGYALVALGGYCLISIHLFGLVKYPFMLAAGATGAPFLINLVKLVLCFVILIFPTTVIGMMFPAMTYLYSLEFKNLGRDVASLYFLDTFGAAAGAATCGFLFVPYVGLASTSYAAGVIYILLGFIVLRLERGAGEAAVAADVSKGVETGPEAIASEKRGLGGLRWLLLAALFVSGFSALVLEVTWSRYFHLLFGSSIYAFSLVVAAFLLGLAVGSIVIRRYLDRFKNPLLVFAYLEVLIAGFSLLTLQTSGWIESFYYDLFFSVANFYIFQGILFTIAFALMLLPASLMGANFPLAIRIFSRDLETRGEDVGITFAVNTAGGIIGAFAAGFLIIPVLGLEDTNIVASALYLVIGVAFLVIAAGRKKRYYVWAALFTLAFVVFGYVNYGEPPLAYSIYYNGIRFQSLEQFREFKKGERLVYSKHGQYGLVSVSFTPKLERFILLNNGKVDASTSRADMATQLMLGHTPLFFHRDPAAVLNIGLGGGFTLGAIKAHPNVREIDAVEIDPLVVEATRLHFAPFNNDALNDSRVKVHIADGRHFLQTTNKRYDVVVSEPPNIWVSGVSQLFTREFYGIVDEHLKPGGILAQWVPGYELSETDQKLILNTIHERFAYVAYWYAMGDIIIVASHTELKVVPGYVNALFGYAPLERNMSLISRWNNPVKTIRRLYAPTVSFDQIPGYLSGTEEINTDDLPRLEFRTARNVFDFGLDRFKNIPGAAKTR